MINESSYEFTDISSEKYRIYDFGDHTFTIENPTHLSVSLSGGHRVFNAFGESFYVSPKFLAVRWVAKDGQPNFVK